jgi:chromosome partitioning protein
VLRRKFAIFEQDYDFILMDTGPSLNLLTLNSLIAADYVLIPTQPEPLCIYGLASLKQTLDTLIADGDNPNLRLLGFFITFYDGRLKAHRDLERQLREGWEDQILKAVIKRRPTMLETTLEGRSALTLKSGSELAAEYRVLTDEVISRVGL